MIGRTSRQFNLNGITRLGKVLLGALLVSLTIGVFAEEIPMANGSRLEGELIEVHADTLRVRTAQGELLAPKSTFDPRWLATKTQTVSPASTDSATQLALLQARVAALEAEIRALRAELALTRSTAAPPPAQAPPEPVAAPEPVAPQAKTAPTVLGIASSLPQSGFWLSESSSIRHNRTCRYYMKSAGRPCRQDEGRACTKCKG